jgi:pectin methylesterase-like acyl-CoA thioesterase
MALYAKAPRAAGRDIYVSTVGSDNHHGLNWANAKATFAAAVARASAGDRILIAPGKYSEVCTIPRAKSNITVIGVGGKGSVYFEATTNGTGLTNEADDITIENVGFAGNGTGHAVVNRGRRLRMEDCKLEAGTNGLRLTLGSDAQITALTHGKGDDLWFIGCEISGNTTGVMLVCTDYGAVTQVRFRDCTFHDNTKDFDETVGAGGSAAITFRDLDIEACKFRRKEDGTEPTAYIDLNANNANSGVVADNSFPTALAGAKNLVSTALIWTANKHTGGISNAQPS